MNAVRETREMCELLDSACLGDLTAIAELCADTLQRGGKLFFCGNGGSAAECQHLATEFVVRLSAQRERKALAAIALTTDTSLLTACSNDYGYDFVFARQIEALMKPDDVLILLSTSGRSPNLLLAAEAVGKLGGRCIAMVGKDSTPLDRHCTNVLHVPSTSGQRVQEAHLLCGHLLVELIEDLLLNGEESARPTR
ncbi:MAG: SIS domain-containing protein [Calditrichaeota bacterium]|nr:SIS domain-containing protein [Calditrichota bacterium]